MRVKGEGKYPRFLCCLGKGLVTFYNSSEASSNYSQHSYVNIVLKERDHFTNELSMMCTIDNNYGLF